MINRLLVHVLLPAALATAPLHGASGPLVCRPTPGAEPAPSIAMALEAVGGRPGTVLHLTAWRSQLQDFQSDRTYAPFFSAYSTFETWYDAGSGAERYALTAFAFPRTFLPGSSVILSGPRASWVVTDSSARPVPPLHSRTVASHPLNPWAVLADFRSGAVRSVGRCEYRDYPRYALERTGPLGVERLLLDVKTHVPVALLRAEAHPLWGQVQVEYVWSNWDRVAAGVLYPLTTFRQVDGRTEVAQTVTALALVPADSSPPLILPDTALAMPATTSVFDRPTPPDTVRAGVDTWLLRSREYTTAVTLRRDTVFVLDATLSEARARLDQDWVARLFPRRHPVVLVVTDLAWPHIGGVRSWVAQGATVVSHRASRAFLDSVIARRWTAAPDQLERQRTRTRFRFRAVDDSLVLAGGDLVLHAIDGISSEGALMAWVADDRFLWASDFVQDLSQPTEYGREVVAAARRVRLAPDRFAAEHLGLTPWSRLQDLFAAEDRPAGMDAGPAPANP